MKINLERGIFQSSKKRTVNYTPPDKRISKNLFGEQSPQQRIGNVGEHSLVISDNRGGRKDGLSKTKWSGKMLKNAIRVFS